MLRDRVVVGLYLVVEQHVAFEPFALELLNKPGKELLKSRIHPAALASNAVVIFADPQDIAHVILPALDSSIDKDRLLTLVAAVPFLELRQGL